MAYQVTFYFPFFSSAAKHVQYVIAAYHAHKPHHSLGIAFVIATFCIRIIAGHFAQKVLIFFLNQFLQVKTGN